MMKLECVVIRKYDRDFPNLYLVLDDGTRIPVDVRAVSDKQRKYFRHMVLEQHRKEVK